MASEAVSVCARQMKPTPVAAVTKAWCWRPRPQVVVSIPLLLLGAGVGAGPKGPLPARSDRPARRRAWLAAWLSVFRLRHAQTGQSNHSWLRRSTLPWRRRAGAAAPMTSGPIDGRDGTSQRLQGDRRGPPPLIHGELFRGLRLRAGPDSTKPRKMFLWTTPATGFQLG